MSDIFLSYKSEDRERAKSIAVILEQQDFSVWWDRDIPIGRSVDQFIVEKLYEANCVIVLWSRKSVESDWVKDEADEGKKRGILFPVLIDDVDIPLGFRRIQTARLIDWKGELSHPDFERLLKSVAEKLGKTKVPEEKDGIKKEMKNTIKKYSRKSKNLKYPVMMTPSEKALFQALEDEKWDWRTIGSLQNASRMTEEQVHNTLYKYDTYIMKSSIPDNKGNDLYTLRSRYRERNRP